MLRNIAIAEPEVKHPVKMHGNKRGDVGVRLSSALLAGYLREKNKNVNIGILPYRLQAYLGRKRNLKRDLNDFDVVCVGASTNEFPDAHKILKTAKEMGKITVIGGIFPTSNIDYVLNLKCVDFVVRGEGEATFADLVTTLQKGRNIKKVKGISYKKGSDIIYNLARPLIKNIDCIKPAYDLLPMKKYIKLSSGAIYSARGCFNNCSFCTVSKHWKFSYRPRSIKNVLEEVRTLIDYGFKQINFKDESITLDKERTKNLLKALKKENFNVAFKAKSRIDDLTEEIMDLMLDTNLTTLHFGIESISQKSLDRMAKGTSSKDIKMKLQKGLEKGFKLNPVFMLGYSGQTINDLKLDAEFIKSLGKNKNVITYLSCMTPHPRSKIWTDAKGYGLTILTGDLNNYTHKRLVAVPNTLGSPKEALDLLYNTQKEIVDEIDGLEHNPRLDIKGILKENPELKHTTKIKLGYEK